MGTGVGGLFSFGTIHTEKHERFRPKNINIQVLPDTQICLNENLERTERRQRYTRDIRRAVNKHLDDKRRNTLHRLTTDRCWAFVPLRDTGRVFTGIPRHSTIKKGEIALASLSPSLWQLVALDELRADGVVGDVLGKLRQAAVENGVANRQPRLRAWVHACPRRRTEQKHQHQGGAVGDHDGFIVLRGTKEKHPKPEHVRTTNGLTSPTRRSSPIGF